MTRSEDAAPFIKVRRDHATETAEDYVEAVAEILDRDGECRVRDLARHMGVSHVTVTRIVSRLVDSKLVDTRPYRPIELTPAGRQLAEACRARHELVVAFLRRIGVPDEIARRDAEGIEHHVSEKTLGCMRRFIETNGETS